MAQKGKGTSVNLDSFLDIMTCLVGVLVLIIILTGLDAAQIRVLIPTPIERTDIDKRPIFIEARNNELFLLPLTDLQNRASAALNEISQQTRGQLEQMMRMLSEVEVSTDDYRIDLSFALVGQFAVLPEEGSTGYRFVNWEQETERDWYGRILNTMDKEEEMVAFIVRDDSFAVFKRARHLAWQLGVDVSYELVGMDEPIKFGLLGEGPRAQ